MTDESNYKFTRNSGPSSPDRDTGPRVDLTLGTTNGFYYLASPRKKTTVKPTSDYIISEIVSPSLATPDYVTEICGYLGVYMWGSGIDQLKVSYVDEFGQKTSLLTVNGNQGPLWLKPMFTFERSSSSVKIVIETSINRKSKFADIAIDDVVVQFCSTEEADYIKNSESFLQYHAE